jgi:hypothetical protein
MHNKLAPLVLPLALTGCFESEESCYDRLKAEINRSLDSLKEQTMFSQDSPSVKDARYVLEDISWTISQIYQNDDLNACDYTLLNHRLIKID